MGSASPPRPWRRLKSSPALDFGIFRLRQETVAHPLNDSEHQRVVIDAPDWVNVVPITRQGEVVLIRQFRFGIGSSTLEIPGGTVEPNEEPIDAASRELEEETGYRPGRIELLGSVHPNPAFQNNRCYSYLARDCERVHQGHPEAGEDIAVELRALGEISGLIAAGEITHSLVICAFYYLFNASAPRPLP